MRKICVFVEGQTEQIFVREFLLKWFEYSHLSMECHQIIGSQTIAAEYDYNNHEADYHYQIVNVGNDNRVLSWLLDRVDGLKREGYELIVGLRDMYSQYYRKKSSVIDLELNKQIISAAYEEIQERLQKNAAMVSFHFAIMEIEAWMLAMYPSLLKKFPAISEDDLKNIYNIEDDVEQTIYHPADTLNKVFNIVGSTYQKHKSDANSIVRFIEKEDFEVLLESGKSQTFKNFVNALVPMN